jgi:hypothetical protein
MAKKPATVNEWCRWENGSPPRIATIAGPPCAALGEAAAQVIAGGIPAACGCDDPEHDAALVFEAAQGWQAWTCSRADLPVLVERMRLFARFTLTTAN